jgi:hypothetical protein
MNELLSLEFIREHSGELVILILACLLVGTLVIVVPQLLRHNMRKMEMLHEQRLKSLEKGIPLPVENDRARLAGRTATLVPMVVMIATATVTSFLVVYKSENMFAVSLAIWIVGGMVSLAAITGGVALIGRLAQIEMGEKEEDEEDKEYSEESYKN